MVLEYDLSVMTPYPQFCAAAMTIGCSLPKVNLAASTICVALLVEAAIGT